MNEHQQQHSPAPTFAHTNEQSTLQGILNLQRLTLSLSLKYPSLHFPKVYQKTLQQSTLPTNIGCIFGDLISLYKVMKNNQLVHVSDSSGNIKVKYSLIIAGEEKARQLDIQLERNLENELEQMRLIVGKESEKLGKIEELEHRIDRLWQREQETQKIFLKFKQEIQSKTEEISQRQTIQTTKLSIIQQDLHKLSVSFNKLSTILCPIFPHLNVQSEFTSQFIIQDRKIVYVGENGRWTQILFNSDVMEKKKVQFSYKIVCSKKGNVVAGITLVTQAGARSSICNGKGEKEKKYLGVNGYGQIFTHKQNNENSDNCLMIPQNEEQCIDNEKQHKSSHEITLPSPATTILARSPSVSSKPQSEVFKPMQVIKMCVDLERNKIIWKNGSKSLIQAKIWQQYKNESIVPYFQFSDTGDAVEWIQG